MKKTTGMIIATVIGAVIGAVGSIIANQVKTAQSQIVNVAGDQIFIDRKPIARFVQKFEMLDKVIPLANGQIITFFVPTISVEYLNGDKEAIELPKANYEEVLQALDAAVQADPELKYLGDELSINPEALRRMLRKHEDKEDQL